MDLECVVFLKPPLSLSDHVSHDSHTGTGENSQAELKAEFLGPSRKNTEELGKK